MRFTAGLAAFLAAGFLAGAAAFFTAGFLAAGLFVVARLGSHDFGLHLNRFQKHSSLRRQKYEELIRRSHTFGVKIHTFCGFRGGIRTRIWREAVVRRYDCGPAAWLPQNM